MNQSPEIKAKALEEQEDPIIAYTRWQNLFQHLIWCEHFDTFIMALASVVSNIYPFQALAGATAPITPISPFNFPPEVPH